MKDSFIYSKKLIFSFSEKCTYMKTHKKWKPNLYKALTFFKSSMKDIRNKTSRVKILASDQS